MEEKDDLLLAKQTSLTTDRNYTDRESPITSISGLLRNLSCGSVFQT